MLVFLVWLIDVFNNLRILAKVGIMFIAICILALLAMAVVNTVYDKVIVDVKAKFRYLNRIAIVILTLFIVIPTKQTYYAMVGAYASQVVIDSPQAKVLFDKSIKAIEIKLDEVINSKKETTAKE